jgi:hypothetical protein
MGSIGSAVSVIHGLDESYAIQDDVHRISSIQCLLVACPFIDSAGIDRNVLLVSVYALAEFTV